MEMQAAQTSLYREDVLYGTEDVRGVYVPEPAPVWQILGAKNFSPLSLPIRG
jgi:hypothetical protein